MRENHRAIDDIHTLTGDWAEIVAGQLNELSVVEFPKIFRGVAQHVGRDIGADPAAAARRHMFANPSNPAADFQNDVVGTDADVVEEELRGGGAAAI